MKRPLWQPSAERIKNSNLSSLMAQLKEKKGLEFASYDELYKWSVEERADFWESVWEYGGIIASKGYDEVMVDGDKMPGAQWFTGARLNFAENLLRSETTAKLWSLKAKPRKLSASATRNYTIKLPVWRRLCVKPGSSAVTGSPVLFPT